MTMQGPHHQDCRSGKKLHLRQPKDRLWFRHRDRGRGWLWAARWERF